MSTNEHSRAFGGFRQAAGSYKQACMGSKVTLCVSKGRAVVWLYAKKVNTNHATKK